MNEPVRRFGLVLGALLLIGPALPGCGGSGRCVGAEDRGRPEQWTVFRDPIRPPPKSRPKTPQCGNAQVRPVANAARSRILRCYERKAANHPSMEGHITVRWIYGHDGKVTMARIEESTLCDEEVEQCVLEVIGGLEFPMPGVAQCSVRMPFRFIPGL